MENVSERVDDAVDDAAEDDAGQRPAIDRRIRVRTLGMRRTQATRDAMIAFTGGRDETTPDEIWLLEHAPVYTLGQAGRLVHLHEPVDVPVVRTERGGQITYHGPGQLVAYLLIDLRRRGIKVRAFVRLIEDGRRRDARRV